MPAAHVFVHLPMKTLELFFGDVVPPHIFVLFPRLVFATHALSVFSLFPTIPVLPAFLIVAVQPSATVFPPHLILHLVMVFPKLFFGNHAVVISVQLFEGVHGLGLFRAPRMFALLMLMLLRLKGEWQDERATGCEQVYSRIHNDSFG